MTARNYKNLISLIQIIIPRVNFSLLESLSIQVIDPMCKKNMKCFARLITKSLVCRFVKKFKVILCQNETPLSDDIYFTLDWILQKSPRLKKLTLLHQNYDEYEENIKAAFDKLRKEQYWVDLRCGSDKGKSLSYADL